MSPISLETRLHIVTGKGGTGKTTVAAALALALAEGGRRTLLIEVEGRQALAQLFDRPALPYEEQRLATASGGGEVFGLAIDPEQALLDYLEMFYNMKRAGRVLRRMGAIDFVTTLAPGMRDVLLTGKVKEAVVRRSNGKARDGDRETHLWAYDAVVVDAPPIGRIRGFLDVTAEVQGLTKVGPIAKQSQGVSDVLHSDKTAIHLVTLLEEMPVQETVDAVADLREGGYELGAIVVNRHRPEFVAAGQVSRRTGNPRVDTAAVKRGLSGTGIDPALAAALAAQATEYVERQDLQTANRERLDATDVPIVVLPELPPPVGPGELNELALAFREDEPVIPRASPQTNASVIQRASVQTNASESGA